MIVREDDAGLVGNAGLLQPLHQILQRILKLQVAGDVRLDRIRIGEIFHCGPVLGAHGIVPVVLVMAAEGHVVGVEGGRAVDVIVDGGFHHFKVGGRPVDLHVQARIRCLEVIAHVGMGDVAVVEITDVVVIAVGGISHFVQRVAETERKVVGARHVEARIRLGAGHIREEAHAHGVFAVGGDGLERAVVVFKNNARVGHFVEGGRQLLTDEPWAEALCADGYSPSKDPCSCSCGWA